MKVFENIKNEIFKDDFYVDKDLYSRFIEEGYCHEDVDFVLNEWDIGIVKFKDSEGNPRAIYFKSKDISC